MTQRDFETAVAKATGEDLQEIRRRGFSRVQPELRNFDPEPDDLAPQMIDWDELDRRRNVPLVPQPWRALQRTA